MTLSTALGSKLDEACLVNFSITNLLFLIACDSAVLMRCLIALLSLVLKNVRAIKHLTKIKTEVVTSWLIYLSDTVSVRVLL